MSEQTVENIAKIKLRNLAKELDYMAVELPGLIKTLEARQHAKELRGAARMVRQWAREVCQ